MTPLYEVSRSHHLKIYQMKASLGSLCLALTDYSPIRQTSELGKIISTAGKSIMNLVKL